MINDTIKKDLSLTKVDIANSNIIALLATLLVRFAAGPACDKIGPRSTFAACLIIGAIPTFLAGTCYTKSQLLACRFFVGILGGAFVPCQVWSTGFYDKNVVGTSNSIIAGWGNSGGGVTYFLMPSIYNALRHDNLSAHTAWRVAFVVPGIVILTVAAGLYFLCDDTPTGKWSERHLHVQENLAKHGVTATVVDAPKGITEKTSNDSGSHSPAENDKGYEYNATGERKLSALADHEAQFTEQQMLDTARGEVIQKPTWKQTLKVMGQPQTLVCALCYFCSFGAELAINSVLATYYQKNFKTLGQTSSGQWAAMFGLLNIVTRPLGGITSDILYRKTGSVWAKKMLMHGLGLIAGAFLLAIGFSNPMNSSTMFGLIAGFAIFLEAGNGANFSLVPHVNPQANGVVSGMTGGTGNLGGIIFSIIFRYEGNDYAKSFWIIGLITIALNVVLVVVPPVSKRQIGGR